ELYGNDMVRGIPAARIQQNLETMIQHFQEAHIQVVLTGHKGITMYGPEYAKAIEAIHPYLQEKYGVTLYPNIFEGLDKPELIQEDGVHPNAAGIDVMVDRLAPGLEKVLDVTPVRWAQSQARPPRPRRQ
ncbi:MAG: hypothetical protein K2Q01_08160, partial [Rickettsiales bacterium]|nr:hypothetical protein [Rickettsiales bacterium]